MRAGPKVKAEHTTIIRFRPGIWGTLSLISARKNRPVTELVNIYLYNSLININDLTPEEDLELNKFQTYCQGRGGGSL